MSKHASNLYPNSYRSPIRINEGYIVLTLIVLIIILILWATSKISDKAGMITSIVLSGLIFVMFVAGLYEGITHNNYITNLRYDRGTTKDEGQPKWYTWDVSKYNFSSSY